MTNTLRTQTGRPFDAEGIVGILNLLDYGVRGDGAALDGTNLNRFFTSWPTVTVILPPTPNGYNIDTNVTLERRSLRPRS